MSRIASIHALPSSLALSPVAACLHARSGAFVLAPAQALALRPKQSSTIRITGGSAWITLGDGCDYFLKAEQELHVPAGSRLVIESMREDGVVKFDWQLAIETGRERSAARSRMHAVAPQAASAPSLREHGPLEYSPLSQALLDLRGATALAARGLSGLATALTSGLAAGMARALGVGLAEVRVGRLAEAPVGGLAARARSAHSSARAAQGRMASCESIASSGAA
jgi:Protein of unknown function (DUF2917)